MRILQAIAWVFVWRGLFGLVDTIIYRYDTASMLQVPGLPRSARSEHQQAPLQHPAVPARVRRGVHPTLPHPTPRRSS